MKVIAIIAAGGIGARIGAGVPKQFINVKGKPILAYTLLKFNLCSEINEIILTAPKGYERLTQETVEAYHIDRVTKIAPGGANRQETVYNALIEARDADVILVHDAARPFVTCGAIERSIAEARVTGACSIGVPTKDTIKICDKFGFVINTPPRETLWQIQTPQAFLYPIIRKAHEQARLDGYTATDDLELTERIGHPARIIMGSYANIKITTREDLLFFSLGGDAYSNGGVYTYFTDVDGGVSDCLGWDNTQN
ncbi:MAG: 2-C-methyl-D-erythritol 4-phosphate cytidylyltransferase [Clostridiales bacterium]|jgi:2-C-methyl-D-erythritol 4-phosphate cytidylyltransferase|nr:2-C-methyl-D-erythritol 4-phosphate cytidylyltransferase [Clostridiales bacterium]